jgi:hypothetical protein
MSVGNSLLFEPAPFNYYLAIRADGVSGSGRLDDPWDASTQPRFDAVMKKLNDIYTADPNAALLVNLGQGTF